MAASSFAPPLNIQTLITRANQLILSRLIAVFVALVLTNQYGAAQDAAQDAALHAEDFDSDTEGVPSGWTVVSGNWHLSNGTLVADSIDSEAYITFGDDSWENYEVKVDVTFRKVRSPSRWLSVLVRAQKDGSTPWSQVPIRFQTSSNNGVEFAARTTTDQWSVRQTASAPSASKLNQPREIKVAVRGSHVQAFLDGNQVISSHLCVDRASGCVGLGVSGCIATFDNFSLKRLRRIERETHGVSNRCENVAHRGFSAAAPENTLAAITEAIAAGASGCEFDVYGCRDGTVVLMHDKTVDRTTDGTGPVTELSLRELQRFDAGSWKDPKYADQRVPTLTQALQSLRGSGCRPVVEIKMEGISERVVGDIRSLDMVDQVDVIAFSQNVVREIRQLEPQIRCAWLCNETLEGTPAEQADWLESRANVCGTKLLDLNFKMLSPELVRELKRRGLGVWTWTVDESAVMAALRQWGVDSITTNRPDLLQQQMQ
ncbi:MAG: hypothetical protein HKN47_03005 [Pirellulaceae bacterium]|nr:hypothetical protein [Pirellulaceae bacterium]